MSRALSVWWDGVIVGTLRVDQHGDMTFVYASAWLADASRPSLSISLPKRPAPFNRRGCRPFFAGLLPEEAQLEAVARALGISKRNDFRLLEALEEIGNSTWAAFAADVGLGTPFIRRRVRALTDSAQRSVFGVVDQIAEEGLDREALAKYASLVASRATRLAKTV